MWFGELFNTTEEKKRRLAEGEEEKNIIDWIEELEIFYLYVEKMES